MADIIIAGILVADIIKLISHYPQKGMLADISKVTYGIGGCAANTAVSVKKLDPSINVKSVALVGKDEQGTFVKKKLSEYGIDISMIQETDREVTGVTDVMTIESTGERTFFLNRGANKIFDESNLQIEEEEGSIILLGYGGILDALNKPNNNPINIANANAKNALSIFHTRFITYIGTYMATHPIAGKDTSIPPAIITIISHNAKHIVKIPARQSVISVAGLKNAGCRRLTIMQYAMMI